MPNPAPFRPEEVQAAAKAALVPEAMPDLVYRRFYLQSPYRNLPSVAISDLRSAVSTWKQTVSEYQQILQWYITSTEPSILQMRTRLDMMERSILEVDAELERRVAKAPFPGSITFDRSAYITDMRSTGLSQWWNNDPFDKRDLWEQMEDSRRHQEYLSGFTFLYPQETW